MLHGNPTWSFFYRNLIQDLCHEVRCVAPDHIRMGLSDKPAAYDYTLASRIADLEALVLELELTRIDLIVHRAGAGQSDPRIGHLPARPRGKDRHPEYRGLRFPKNPDQDFGLPGPLYRPALSFAA